MTEEEKEKLFIFLRRCEEQEKSFMETLNILNLTKAVTLTEAIDILAEYRRNKAENKDGKE